MMDLSPDARTLYWASRHGGRVYEVAHRPSALRIGRSSYVSTDWGAGLLAGLWILVRRKNPTWSPRKIAEFLVEDLGLSGRERLRSGSEPPELRP